LPMLQNRNGVWHCWCSKFYVSLVDISQDDCYSSSRFREMNEIEITWKQAGNYTAPAATRADSQGDTDVRDPLRST
jgi:hypothetical protein